MDSNTLDDLIEAYQRFQLSKNRAKGTKDRYGFTFAYFRRFVEETGLPSDASVITTATMEAFTIWLRDLPIKPQHGSTVRSEVGIHCHLRDMRAFTKWLYRNEYLQKEVFCPMPTMPKRLFRVLDETEVERMWSSAYLTGNSTRSIRNRAMVALMLDTGIRREEAASLTLRSLNLEARRLTVIGKGNKERRVFFSPRVREYLREFLSIRGIDDEPLFHLSSAGIRTTFRRIKDETGLEHFHPHLLRHQFATEMVRKGTTGDHLSMLLGHEDYSTTRRYVNLTDEDLLAAHDAASPFVSVIKDQPDELQRRRQRYSTKRAG